MPRIERMPIVRVRGPLKAKAAGQSEHELPGSTVIELLRELERAHPDVTGWILDERGIVRRHINVFVNGELCEGATPVEPGDRVDVLPAISGG
jgi:molybdopterin synthase sulfur carrier subunit